MPHYGQLVLWTVLACSFLLCYYFEFYYGNKRASDLRTGPVSVLSFLPDAILLNRGVVIACGVVFAGAALLWAFRYLIPWSSWAAALSFNAVVAAFTLENSSRETHVAHVAGGFLLIYALWYHFYAKEIRDASTGENRFWRTALYPRWVLFVERLLSRPILRPVGV